MVKYNGGPVRCESVLNLRGPKCHYCDKYTSPDLPQGHALRTTLEHIVPKMLGGTFATYNLVIACRKCNNCKGNEFFKCFCETCKNARAEFELRRLVIGAVA